MIINVQQSIHIQMIKIGGITNSSVFQIGTSGIITPCLLSLQHGWVYRSRARHHCGGRRGIKKLVLCPFRKYSTSPLL